MSKSVNRNAEHSRYSTSADSRTGNDTKEMCQNSASKFFVKNFLLKKSSPFGGKADLILWAGVEAYYAPG